VGTRGLQTRKKERGKIMTMTGLRTFDVTLHKTNEWLSDIMQEIHTEDRQEAYHALRATLHALRDRLPIEIAAHLSAQLPLLVRGIFFENWTPTGKPDRLRREEQFLQTIERNLGRTLSVDIRMATMSVLKVMKKHLSEGELDNIKDSLPEDFSGLFAE